MPCTSVRATVVLSAKLKGANQAVLAKALELMHEVVKKVEVVNESTLRVETTNGTVYIDINKDTVRMQGEMSKYIEPRLTDYYMAAIQIANLKKRQMRVSVETDQDRIRIRAE
jgi:archaellum component FlaF (FlaF/FlaG flagellin family)